MVLRRGLLRIGRIAFKESADIPADIPQSSAVCVAPLTWKLSLWNILSVFPAESATFRALPLPATTHNPQYALGLVLSSGEGEDVGIPQDDERARELFKTAAIGQWNVHLTLPHGCHFFRVQHHSMSPPVLSRIK